MPTYILNVFCYAVSNTVTNIKHNQQLQSRRVQTLTLNLLMILFGLFPSVSNDVTSNVILFSLRYWWNVVICWRERSR